MELVYKRRDVFITRVLPILLMAFFFILCLSSNVFASSVDVNCTFNDTDYEVTLDIDDSLTTEFSKIFIIYSDRQLSYVNNIREILCFFSNSDIFYRPDGNRYVYYTKDNSSFHLAMYFYEHSTAIQFSKVGLTGFVSSLSYDYNTNSVVSTKTSYYIPVVTASYSERFFSPDKIIYSNFDILDNDGNVVHAGIINTFRKLPHIGTIDSDLSLLNFDYLTVYTNDYYNEDVYLLVYDKTDVGTLDNLYPRKEILLNIYSPYFCYLYEHYSDDMYEIPRSDLGLTFRLNGTYAFRFALLEQTEFEGEMIDTYSYLTDYISFSLSSLLTEDDINAINPADPEPEPDPDPADPQISAINGVTSAVKEQTDVSRGIWGTIKSILNFINPFSEDFFVYRLKNYYLTV